GGRGRVEAAPPPSLAPGIDVGAVVVAAPVAQPRGRRRLRRDQAVVPGEAGECQLQHHFGRPLRPALGALCRLQAHLEAAHIDEDAGELRSYGRQCPVDTLPGGDHVVAELGAGSRYRAAYAPAGREARPVGGHARGELGTPIVGREALARRELRLGDERLAILVLAASEPSQRTLLRGAGRRG